MTRRFPSSPWLIAIVLGATVGAIDEAHGAIPVVDDCQEADYVDRRAAGADRELDWDYPFPYGPERCLTIQVGQSVRWVGNFGDHPLDPDQGTTPNPIAAHADGTVVFTQPGIYGFRCNYHFAMRGAIQVVAAPPAASVPWGSRAGLVVLALLLLWQGRKLSIRKLRFRKLSANGS